MPRELVTRHFRARWTALRDACMMKIAGKIPALCGEIAVSDGVAHGLKSCQHDAIARGVVG
jgi:hypothetical protein